MQRSTSQSVRRSRSGHDLRRSTDVARRISRFTSAVGVPVLANVTEFGRTPLFTVDELCDVGVRLVLYPLTAFRAMNAAAARVYQTLCLGNSARIDRFHADARRAVRVARLLCERATQDGRSCPSMFVLRSRQSPQRRTTMTAGSQAGLEGVVAGHTALSTVGKEGAGLTYAGYAIEDLADHATFEEVAWLLFHGDLPNREQLDGFSSRLRRQRSLPDGLKVVLERLPASRIRWMCCGPVVRLWVARTGAVVRSTTFAWPNDCWRRFRRCSAIGTISITAEPNRSSDRRCVVGRTFSASAPRSAVRRGTSPGAGSGVDSVHRARVQCIHFCGRSRHRRCRICIPR